MTPIIHVFRDLKKIAISDVKKKCHFSKIAKKKFYNKTFQIQCILVGYDEESNLLFMIIKASSIVNMRNTNTTDKVFSYF